MTSQQAHLSPVPTVRDASHAPCRQNGRLPLCRGASDHGAISVAFFRSIVGTVVVLLIGLFAGSVPLQADEFRVRLPEGGEETIEARLVGSGQGALVLELADGQYRLVPEGAVADRKIADGPEPLSGDAIAARLAGRFGPDVTYTLVKEPFVYVLVVASPLGRTSDTRAKNFLQRVATFFKNVDQAFVAFLKETKLKVVTPTHPLPVLIFESQDDFDKYARSITGGNGLSVGRVLGFYSELTNMLAIRLSECRTFDTPLHEAIHQLSFNHQMLPRLASIPRWFAEGLATGFEANQGRVNIGPALVSARYARQVREARMSVSRPYWPTMLHSRETTSPPRPTVGPGGCTGCW